MDTQLLSRTRWLRHQRPLSLAALAAGCLWFAAALPGAASACQARDFSFDKGWVHEPLSKLKRDTVYTLVKEEGRTVLRAVADRSASAYVAPIQPPVSVPTSLSWRWKTDALVPGADNRERSREDAPLRVMLAFDGDHSTLSEKEQTRFKRAKTLTGQELPYATLMYIWSEQVPVETVIPSTHTSQVKMLVVASGTAGLGQWQSVRRNVAADYRRAYGAEPGAVLSVSVMSDTDNTGEKAVGEYADIRFDCAGAN
ncbi:MAG: DUF3047 domain-containing protein [Ramlibacter sp.]